MAQRGIFKIMSIFKDCQKASPHHNADTLTNICYFGGKIKSEAKKNGTLGTERHFTFITVPIRAQVDR